MELKWLEDFLSLVDTRSFSAAADERCTTQSTLSRRISALEDWLGVDLVDRSSHPVKLSRAGEQFHKEALDIVRSSYRARAATRSRGLQSIAPLHFGAQHALARYYLPDVLRRIESEVEISEAYLKSDNLGNIVDDLIGEQIDFLICYHHPSLPPALNQQRFPSLLMSTEVTVPVSVPNDDGTPRFALPGNRDNPLPYLGFTPDVPVGWHRQAQFASKDLKFHVYPIYETNMGEILRELILDGRGVGWLQNTLIDDDLEAGRLVHAGDEKWAQTIEIRIFRTLGPGRPHVERVWDVLVAMAQLAADNK